MKQVLIAIVAIVMALAQPQNAQAQSKKTKIDSLESTMSRENDSLETILKTKVIKVRDLMFSKRALEEAKKRKTFLIKSILEMDSILVKTTN
jgi:hypothetical protein